MMTNAAGAHYVLKFIQSIFIVGDLLLLFIKVEREPSSIYAIK